MYLGLPGFQAECLSASDPNQRCFHTPGTSYWSETVVYDLQLLRSDNNFGFLTFRQSPLASCGSNSATDPTLLPSATPIGRTKWEIYGGLKILRIDSQL